jgi:hypothetical protein
MNKKQEELMKKIKKMQEKNVEKQKKALRKQKKALQAGYIAMIFVTSSLSWLVWAQLSKIEGIPYLTYWQGLVYTLLVYATIFLTARVVRLIQKGK